MPRERCSLVANCSLRSQRRSNAFASTEQYSGSLQNHCAVSDTLSIERDADFLFENTATTVAGLLVQLTDRVDDVIGQNITADHDDVLRSHELLADGFDL